MQSIFHRRVREKILVLALMALWAICPNRAGAVVTYSSNWKPAWIQTVVFQCVDTYTGWGVPYAQISISVDWVANSNSHLHPYTYGHPKSSLSPSGGTTDGIGNFATYLQTSQIGQDEWFTINCYKPGYSTRPGYWYFTVGYADVFYNDHPEVWEKIGATVKHGGVEYNRYMMSDPAYAFFYLTLEFLNAFPDQPGGRIGANDMSLPYGGVFDLNSDWQIPHSFHTRGTAVDVRGNMQAYSVPVSRQQIFRQLCLNKSAALAQIEYANPQDSDEYVADPRRHIHCHWPIVP